jgi:flagellar M-ring protein FliF
MATVEGTRDPTSRAGGAVAALQALAALPVLKQLGVMAGLAASVALGAWVVQWTRTPGYALLYGNLPGKEASEVAAGLERARVPYRLDAGSGAILVPAEDVHRARLTLAAEGLPRSADLGFELLNKPAEMGTSQFLEQARYQHALEVELARSIATLAGVERARVHLALPRQSAFVRERKRPSASVLVHLSPGRGLEQSQVAAVAHLLAASVPGMEVRDVRVVDQTGRLLTVQDQSEAALATGQEFEHVRRLEAYYVRRIEEILGPIVGVDGVRAQVVADLDFTRTEQTRESFDPERTVLRSEQVAEEARLPGGLPVGVPGALSNQPPGPGQAPEQASAAPAKEPAAKGKEPAAAAAAPVSAPQAGTTSRKLTRNYEVDRTVSRTTLPSASLRRLSAAVVLDDVRSAGEEGEPARRRLTPEELDRFTALVKEAIGFDAERGDTVSVMNVAFAAAGPALAEEPGAPWLQSWVWDLGKQAAGVLVVLVLALGVLRPTMRRLASHAPAPRAIPGPAGGAALEAGLAEDRVSLSDGRAAPRARLAGVDRQQQVEAVRALVSEDPKRVAQVVRTWIAEDE